MKTIKPSGPKTVEEFMDSLRFFKPETPIYFQTSWGVTAELLFLTVPSGGLDQPLFSDGVTFVIDHSDEMVQVSQKQWHEERKLSHDIETSIGLEVPNNKQELALTFRPLKLDDSVFTMSNGKAFVNKGTTGDVLDLSQYQLNQVLKEASIVPVKISGAKTGTSRFIPEKAFFELLLAHKCEDRSTVPDLPLSIKLRMPLFGVQRGRGTVIGSSFGLSTQTVNALTAGVGVNSKDIRKPITTLGALAKSDYKQLVRYKNLGRKGMSQITKTLNACKIGHFQAG